MIFPDKCEIKIKLTPDKKHIKALVQFNQDGVRLSGFVLKEGEFGLWLEPPKIRGGKGYITIFFDNNKERYKELQQKVVDLYLEKAKSAPMEDIEGLLDDVKF